MVWMFIYHPSLSRFLIPHGLIPIPDNDKSPYQCQFCHNYLHCVKICLPFFAQHRNNSLWLETSGWQELNCRLYCKTSWSVSIIWALRHLSIYYRSTSLTRLRSIKRRKTKSGPTEDLHGSWDFISLLSSFLLLRQFHTSSALGFHLGFLPLPLDLLAAGFLPKHFYLYEFSPLPLLGFFGLE